jgi:hypothetical protein
LIWWWRRHAATGRCRLETYNSATIDANGDLAIVTTSGQSVLIRKEVEQTAFSAPLISAAKTAVAAQAMFGNCYTSYDIPLQLVVYAGGKVHRFKGVGLPIFQWGFADSGIRIVRRFLVIASLRAQSTVLPIDKSCNSPNRTNWLSDNELDYLCGAESTHYVINKSGVLPERKNIQ